MSYAIAWIAAGGAGLIGALCVWMLTRSSHGGAWQHLLWVLPPVLMLVPAPVPHYPGNFAPAFVVAVFESLFVAEGQPRPALVILAVSAVAATVVTVLLSRALGSRTKSQASAEKGSASD
ncbi:MAG TPA: hypothetical protein VIS76_00845 [Pseudomonadales bacterium]